MYILIWNGYWKINNEKSDSNNNNNNQDLVQVYIMKIKILHQARYFLYFLFLDFAILFGLILLRRNEISFISNMRQLWFVSLLLVITSIVLAPWIYVYIYAYLYNPKNERYKDMTATQANHIINNEEER